MINSEEIMEQDLFSMEQQVTTLLQSKGIEEDNNSIEACHPFPRKIKKNKTDKPAIRMRFMNIKHKNGSDVYLNKHLTKINAHIAKTARFLRKQKRIQSTWTANCKST